MTDDQDMHEEKTKENVDSGKVRTTRNAVKDDGCEVVDDGKYLDEENLSY